MVYGVTDVYAKWQDLNIIENTYEESELGKGNNAETMKSTKVKGGNLYHLGTKAAAAPNESGVLQFYPIAGKDSIANKNFTYVEVYNPYDENFGSFKPQVGKTYKISFDFMTQVWSSNIEFNIRGVKEEGVGEIIANAITIKPGNSTHTGAYAWGKASTTVTIEEEISALSISIEIDKSSDANAYPYLDNIKVEKIPDGDTTFIIYHSVDASYEEITLPNLTPISDISISKQVNGKKIEGIYTDATFTTRADGIIYGNTELWVKWIDIPTKAENTYEEAGISKVVGVKLEDM